MSNADQAGTLDLWPVEDAAPQTEPDAPLEHAAACPDVGLDVEWANRTLDEVAESANRKTALKDARSTIGADILAAGCILIARSKRNAYDRAHAGARLDSTGWLHLNPELAEATLTMTAIGLPINDFPMMPDAVQA
jgi:hypothetical protein